MGLFFRMRYYAASLPRHGARIRRSPQGRSLAGARRPPAAASDSGPSGHTRRCRSCRREFMPSLEDTKGTRFGSAPMAAPVSLGDLTRSPTPRSVPPGSGPWCTSTPSFPDEGDTIGGLASAEPGSCGSSTTSAPRTRTCFWSSPSRSRPRGHGTADMLRTQRGGAWPSGPAVHASRLAGNGQAPAERADLAVPACHYRGKELQMEHDRRVQGRHRDPR